MNSRTTARFNARTRPPTPAGGSHLCTPMAQIIRQSAARAWPKPSSRVPMRGASVSLNRDARGNSPISVSLPNGPRADVPVGGAAHSWLENRCPHPAPRGEKNGASEGEASR